MSTLALCSGLALVGATAWLVTRRLGLPSDTGTLIGAYVVGFAEVVVIALALSAIHAFRASTVLGAVAFLFVCALAASVLRPRPAVAHDRAALRRAIHDPIIAALGLAVAGGLIYSAALLLFTPPNDWDAMTYHLARAAFWIQQHGVSYVANSPYAPINAYPTNAEIGTTFTMVLSGGDRYVGAVQYVAMLATSTATYGVARRIGLDQRAAAFGALAYLTLPVVVLQGSSALNDLVVASFLVVATYFLLGTTRVELLLGGLAVALAVGTKFTALIALPLVALVTLVGRPRRSWPALVLAIGAGAAVGAYWLGVNLVQTGSLDGAAAEVLEENAVRTPAAVLATTTRLLVRFADDMRLGRDSLVYVVVAVLFLAIAALTDRHSLTKPRLAAAGVVAVACIPLAIPFVGRTLLRTHEKFWVTLHEPDLAFLDRNRDPHSPSTVYSYFGPVGFMLLVLGIPLAVMAVRRRSVGPLAVVLAFTPVVFSLLLAAAITYDPFRGRFFMFAVALAASTWGLALRYRWLAWGVAAAAAATLPLAFVHSTEKPAGIRLLDRDPVSSVWGQSREAVQTWLRGGDDTAELVDFFARQPSSGSVGLRVGEDDWVYPYFGRTLDRKVVFVPDGPIDPSLDWLVFRPDRGGEPGARWSLALQTDHGWRVYRPS